MLLVLAAALRTVTCLTGPLEKVRCLSHVSVSDNVGAVLALEEKQTVRLEMKRGGEQEDVKTTLPGPQQALSAVEAVAIAGVDGGAHRAVTVTVQGWVVFALSSNSVCADSPFSQLPPAGATQMAAPPMAHSPTELFNPAAYASFFLCFLSDLSALPTFSADRKDGKLPEPAAGSRVSFSLHLFGLTASLIGSSNSATTPETDKASEAPLVSAPFQG